MASCAKIMELMMKQRDGYKGYVIEARSHQVRGGGFSSEFSVEQHDHSGVTETQFFLPDTFQTEESAIKIALQAGRAKIDEGFQPRTPAAGG